MKTLALTLLLTFGVCSAQEPSPTPQASPQPEATICVYRNFYHVTFGKEAPDITVNGERLAVLDEGRYFVAHVPSGFTIVTSGKKKDNRVELDTRPGETYYFRARAHPGKMFARFELFRVTKEEAKQDADKLHYVKLGDIKSTRVTKDAPFPF
jgi:hypothetical protein